MKALDPTLIKHATILTEDNFYKLGRCKYEGKFSCTLKIFKTSSIPTRETCQKLMEDFNSRILAANPHPSLLQYLGSGLTSSNNLVCLMELVLGEDLFSLLSRKSDPGLLAPEARIKLASDISSGVAFLHSQGILLRNLNSRAILIDQDEGLTPKISNLFEYGILDAIQSQTVIANSVLFYWKAPEDKERSYSSGSREGDLYSLGIVLWEIAAQELPLKLQVPRPTSDEISKFKVSEPGYTSIVGSLLDHTPARRCAAAEVKASLEALIERNPLPASSEPSSSLDTPISATKEPSFYPSYNYRQEELNCMVERGKALYHRGNHVEAAKLFDVPAWNGDGTAQLFLGKIHLCGKGRQRSITMASSWFERASEKGLLEAEYLFAMIHFYQLGGNIGISKPAAMGILEKLSNRGHIKASLMVAFAYESGQGAIRNLYKALKIYEGLSMIHEDPMIFYRLGQINENLALPNFGQAFEWYRRGAAEGNVHCEYQLALCYHHGRGVGEDSKKAMKWYVTAANQNHPACLYIIAHRYLKGYGLRSPDPLLAVKYYTEAASRGHVRAQQMLAHIYEKGNVIAADLKRAAYWYRKAAKLQDPYAQNNLGRFYQNGIGVDLNLARAAKLYEKAAQMGVMQAQVNYARCLELGLGIKAPNPAQAFHWYHKASEQNSPHAQFKLGHCYQRGIGTAPSTDRALDLYRKAANSGYHRAIDKLKQLALG
ncbi:hypothetical protein DSO57_1023251 [Entomophthora muscae]|uniref:Uncharacterized protein n=1 Tax=Entomophthora muscae TaxID=34485 RepID=A0ACC2S4S3_9FUNG|nr:hypothetical protein DSO57_1023251 [Entomophthora muscae]